MTTSCHGRALSPRVLWCFAAISALLAIVSPRTAHAEESIIKRPGDHPQYVFELEPHLIVGYAGPFRDHGQLGFGGRGTVIIVNNGFVKSINNNVGITFGVDVFVGHETLFIPVAMQWNFFLSTHWSVFGEPGVGIAGDGHLHPVLMAGGRYHFNDKIALTMRVGYPALSVGASFFF
jgi:hypothetical protein